MDRRKGFPLRKKLEKLQNPQETIVAQEIQNNFDDAEIQNNFFASSAW